MKKLIDKIITNSTFHAKFLNSLSFMELTGAQKISAYMDKERVTMEQLKHAAEEHRHAFFLKKQLSKINTENYINYTSNQLLAPIYTKHYLHRLDIACSRYLKNKFNLYGQAIKYASYLYVTYLIEIRADILYPLYQERLSQYNSKVNVKSIIAEEVGHLEEMTALLNDFDKNWEVNIAPLQQFEKNLFEEWVHKIEIELNEYINDTIKLKA